MSHPFKEALTKLRISSREAISDGEKELDVFKNYLHVSRHVEIDLRKIIEASSATPSSQLILICGNVGDGKSHLISWLIKYHDDKVRNYKIHNDATESRDPEQTSLDYLFSSLEGFSDDRLNSGRGVDKMILAINLGMLSNLIDDERFSRFTKLGAFIKSHRILRGDYNPEQYQSQNFEEGSSFQVINLADYKFFQLADGVINGGLIREIFQKVTSQTKQNPFYKSYLETYINKSAPLKDASCPMRVNYDYFCDTSVQDYICSLLVRAIVERKIIVSFRSLLNFIYELVVPISLDSVNESDIVDALKNFTLQMRYDSFLLNEIFEHPDISFIHEAINEFDPSHKFNESIEVEIIKILNSNKPIEELEASDLLKNDSQLKVWLSNLAKLNTKETNLQLVKLFVRLKKANEPGKVLHRFDHLYNIFLKNLFFYLNGDKAKLKPLYGQVKRAAMAWHGFHRDEEKVFITAGKPQNKYRFSKEIDLKADISNLKQKYQKEIHKFPNSINLRFKTTDNPDGVVLSIDFNLFYLIQRIEEGYSPNRQDKNRHVDFDRFVQNLTSGAYKANQLEVYEFNAQVKDSYLLEYDDEFDSYTFNKRD